MPSPMSVDELVVLLRKMRRDIDMISRRLEIVITDLAAHRDSSKPRKARKRKAR